MVAGRYEISLLVFNSTSHFRGKHSKRNSISTRAHILFVICRHGSSLFEVLIHTCLKTDLILHAKIHRIFLLFILTALFVLVVKNVEKSPKEYF